MILWLILFYVYKEKCVSSDYGLLTYVDFTFSLFDRGLPRFDPNLLKFKLVEICFIHVYNSDHMLYNDSCCSLKRISLLRSWWKNFNSVPWHTFLYKNYKGADYVVVSFCFNSIKLTISIQRPTFHFQRTHSCACFQILVRELLNRWYVEG